MWSRRSAILFRTELQRNHAALFSGVFVSLSRYNGFNVLTVNYPSQNIYTTLIQQVSFDWYFSIYKLLCLFFLQNDWYEPYYNMYVYMDSYSAANSAGVCATPGCIGQSGTGKRSVRTVQNSTTRAALVSNATAQQICDVYIDSYLNTLSRTPAHRDVHYNSTIESCREMCVFDVTTLGPSVSVFQSRTHVI